MHGIDKGDDHNSCEDCGAEGWDSKNTCFSVSPQPSGTKVAASASHDLQVWGSSLFSFSKRIQVCYFLRQPNYDPYDDPWADDELNNNALGTQMGYMATCFWRHDLQTRPQRCQWIRSSWNMLEWSIDIYGIYVNVSIKCTAGWVRSWVKLGIGIFQICFYRIYRLQAILLLIFYDFLTR